VTGVGISCTATDVTRYSRVVVWLAADVERSVRVRLSSDAYDTLFGGIASEFGADVSVGPEPRAVVINFGDFNYPPWTKEDWTAEQGYTVSDAEARELVLQRFEGLIFGPNATVDANGELSAPTEAGYLRIDNIHFR
jgi:hypothetical protein